MDGDYEAINFIFYLDFFWNQIYWNTLIFHDKYLENQFQNYNHKPLNIFKNQNRCFILTTILTNLSIFISIFYHLFTFQEKEYYLIGYVIGLSLYIFCTLFEIVIYNFYCLREIKGTISILIQIIVVLLINGFELDPTYHGNSNSISFAFIPLGLLISFEIIFYIPRWITSAICLLLIFIVFVIFISLNKYLIMLINITYIVVYIVIFLFIILTSYLKEFQNRFIFFFMIMFERNHENVNEFLHNIQVPIIKCENGKFQFFNSAFSKIIENPLQDNSGKLSHNLNGNTLSNDFRESNILNCFINCEEKIPLSNYIDHEIMIEKETKFNFEFIVDKIYFIKSVILNSFYGKAIIYIVSELQNNLQIEKLQQKIKSIECYMSSVAHDFKTPLNMISSRMDTFINNYLFSEQIKKEMEEVKESAQFVLFMVYDIMDFAQIENNSIRITLLKFNFREQIVNTLYSIAHCFEKADVFFEVEVDFQIPEFIVSDKNRIKQIIMNLLSNAFKFTEKGKIIVHCSLQTPSMIEIKVSDTGQGIKEEDLSKLFSDFCKIDDPNHLNPLGVGLELSICKKLANKLRGDINVISKYNVGSTFRFTFNFEESKKIEEMKNKSIHNNIFDHQEEKIFNNHINLKDYFQNKVSNISKFGDSSNISLNSQHKSELIFDQDSLQNIDKNIDGEKMKFVDLEYIKSPFGKQSFLQDLDERYIKSQDNIHEKTIEGNQDNYEEFSNKLNITPNINQFNNPDIQDYRKALCNTIKIPLKIKSDNTLKFSKFYINEKISYQDKYQDMYNRRKISPHLSYQNLNKLLLTDSERKLSNGSFKEELKNSNPSNNFKAANNYKANINNKTYNSKCISNYDKFLNFFPKYLRINSKKVVNKRKSSSLVLNSKIGINPVSFIGDNKGIEGPSIIGNFPNISRDTLKEVIKVHKIKENDLSFNFLVKEGNKDTLNKIQNFDLTYSDQLPKQTGKELKEDDSFSIANEKLTKYTIKIENSEPINTDRKLLENEKDSKSNKLIDNTNINQNCKCSSILIVDDQAFNRAPIVSFCKKMGLINDEAKDGEQAFLMVKAKTENKCCRAYKYIFMDFNMPKLNGIESSQKIFEIEASLGLSGSKIIGLSGNTSDVSNYDAKLIDKLFWMICPKPMDFETFKELVYGDSYIAQKNNFNSD